MYIRRSATARMQKSFAPLAAHSPIALARPRSARMLLTAATNAASFVFRRSATKLKALLRRDGTVCLAVRYAILALVSMGCGLLRAAGVTTAGLTGAAERQTPCCLPSPAGVQA